MAWRLLLDAKFFGRSSSLLDGGPRGWRRGWLTNRCTTTGASCWGTAIEMVLGAGRPIPRPSYSFFVASWRGERGGGSMSLEEDAVWGVLGEESDFEDTEEESSPSLLSEISMATLGEKGSDAGFRVRGEGRLLAVPTVGVLGSMGGGVILTIGEVTARLPLKTELLTEPRLQETAVSDLDG